MNGVSVCSELWAVSVCVAKIQRQTIIYFRRGNTPRDQMRLWWCGVYSFAEIATETE